MDISLLLPPKEVNDLAPKSSKGLQKAKTMTVSHLSVSCVCCIIFSCVVSSYFSPNSVYPEGFWRLGNDIHKPCGTLLGSVARQLLLLFTVLGEGHARLVYARRSLVSLSTDKLNGFGIFSF